MVTRKQVGYIIPTHIHIFKFKTLKNKTKKRKPQKGAKGTDK